MAFAFDTLGYAKHLRDVGVPQEQAETHAEAARQFIMAELVTRCDLDGVRRELETKIDTVRHELESRIDGLRRDLEGKIDTLSLRLTVRMGVMLAAGVAALAAIIKL